MQKHEQCMGPDVRQTQQEKLLLRVEVAAWLQMPPKTPANWSSDRVRPRPLKLHGFVRYERATVQAWIDESARNAA